MTNKEAKKIMDNLIYLYRPLGNSLKAWHMAIKALEKADKYRWHDLRKNPDDLPETDWSKIEIDTPILVRQGKNGEWLERHFAKHENGDVYAWVDGQTSWTGADEIKWKYAKLAEDEWLPQYCEFAETVCPNTVGVACWEQYLKHMDRKAGEE